MLNKYAMLRFNLGAFIWFFIFGCDSLSVDYDKISMECGGSVDRDHEYFAVKNAQGQLIGMSSDTVKVFRGSQAYTNAGFSPKGCVHIPRNELPVRLKIRSELISLVLDSDEPGQMHYPQAAKFDGQFEIQEICQGSEVNSSLGFVIEPQVWIPEAKLKLQLLDSGTQVRVQYPMDTSADLAGQFNLSRQRLKTETAELEEGDYGIQLQIESDLWETKVYPTLCRLAIDHTPPKLGPIKLGEFLKAGSQVPIFKSTEDKVRLFYQITENALEHSCQAAINQSLVASNDLIQIPSKSGKYFYSIWAVDKAQNCSSAQSGSFVADDQAPPSPELIFKNKKTLTSGIEAEILGSGAILELKSSEENVSFRHCWQKIEDPTTCTMESTSGELIKVPGHGHYRLHVSSRDAAGWESAAMIVEIIVDEKQPDIQVHWNVGSMNETHKFIHLPYAKIEGVLTVKENFEEIASAVDGFCTAGFRNNNLSFSFDGVSCSLTSQSCDETRSCPPGTRTMKLTLDLQSIFNQQKQKSDWNQLDRGKMDVKFDVVDAAGNRTRLSQEIRVELFPWVPIWSLADHRIQGLIDGSWPLIASHGPYVVDNANWVWFETNLGVLAVTRNDIKTFIDHRFFNQKVDIVSAEYSILQDSVNDLVWVSLKNKDQLSLAVYDRQLGMQSGGLGTGWSKIFENKDVSGLGAFMKLIGKRGDSLFIEAGSNSSWKILELDLKQKKFVNTSEKQDGMWAWNGLYLSEGRIFQRNDASVDRPLEISTDLPPLKQLWNQGQDLFLYSNSSIFKASFEDGKVNIKDKWSPSPPLGEMDWVYHANSDKSLWYLSYDNFPALALNYDNTVSLFSPNYITNRGDKEQWFSDHDLGILEFSPVVMTSGIHSLKNNYPEENCFTSTYQFVVTDEQAVLFVCGNKILQVDNDKTEKKVHSLVPLDYVRNLAMTQDGSLLAGNPGGVVRYDAKTREWKDLSKNEGWYESLSGNMHEGIFSLIENRRFGEKQEYRLAVYDETKFELKHDPIIGVEIGSSLSSIKKVLPINRREAYFFHDHYGSNFLRKIRYENNSWIVTKTWQLESGSGYDLMNVGDQVYLIRYQSGIHSMLVIDQDVLKVIPDSERLKGYQNMRLLKSLRRNTVYALATYNTEEGIYELTPQGVKRIAPNSESRVHFNHSFIDSRKRIWGFSSSSTTHFIAERP